MQSAARVEWIQPTSNVLAFRPAKSSNRVAMRDRMKALEWADLARHRGIARVVFHAGLGSEEPAEGDFYLVYETDSEWATWGVAPEGSGFSSWRTGTGQTIGRYRTIEEALESTLRQI